MSGKSMIISAEIELQIWISIMDSKIIPCTGANFVPRINNSSKFHRQLIPHWTWLQFPGVANESIQRASDTVALAHQNPLSFHPTQPISSPFILWFQFCTVNCPHDRHSIENNNQGTVQTAKIEVWWKREVWWKSRGPPYPSITTQTCV